MDRQMDREKEREEQIEKEGRDVSRTMCG